MWSAERPATRPRAAIVLLIAVFTISAGTLRSDDFRPDYHPAAYAIKGAKIVTAPGTTIDVGTVVIRQGVIEAVGPEAKVDVPFDAEVIDGKGLVVYPGFIDLYTTLGQPAGVTRSQTGTGRPVNYADHALARTPLDYRQGLTPEFEVAKVLDVAESLSEERRKLGFTAFLSAPGGAIATGQSALVSLSGLPRREAVVRSPIALHVNVRPPDGSAPPPLDDPAPRRGTRVRERNYPVSYMGAVAHLRQAMIDAEHEHALQEAFAKSGGPRPAFDPALQALYAARSKSVPVWWEANTRDEIRRALDLAEEFGTTAVIVGGQEAAKVADRLKALDVPVVLRLDFAEEPKVPSAADYAQKELAEREEPLAVLADRAARWKERVGTAAALAKAGVRFAFSTDGIAKAETVHAQIRSAISAGLSHEAAVEALTKRAAEIAGVEGQLGTIARGKLGHLVALTAPYGDESAKVRYVFADGLKFDLDKNRPTTKGSDEKPSRKKDAKGETAKVKPAESKETPNAGKTAERAKDEPAKTRTREPEPEATSKTADDQKPTPFTDVATELEETRKPRIKTGGNVLIKDATILTVTKGTIPKGSILVEKGVIKEVGESVTAPKGVTVIEAAGMVAMPGIIDTHSHIAIQGSVNESSLSIVPEVRVKDVVRGDDPDIYRALAGGTTTARLLHGSANTIGGQDAVIKLRHGQAGRDLIIQGAPQGVKFALGENVTRERGRFPNTRMGVEATIERAFEEGRAYQGLWKAYEAAKAKDPTARPPRRDLRLEAIAGILDGSIKIHCHCYRSDEILMLLQAASRHGVRVQSLQHVLEGYKVAPEIAAHGASASTFSDWWAYKIEAYDAIPYNAALLTRAGVRVCIKSDSDELIRHLYLEAAKMVKYGDLTEEQALAMITINPAHELGLEDRLGSIEKGKDADIAIFNAHPFDAFARCELALIDGEVGFQRPGTELPLKPRPGTHVAMPAPDHGSKARNLEIQNNPRSVYALVGATLHPVSAKDIPNGTLVVSDGKILAMGGPETRIPGAAQTIDVHGFDIWPGLIDAGTPLGLYEVGSLSETKDYADTAQYQPELRTSTAIHPDSEWIPVTRANGVLTAYVQPRGGVIAGQGAAIDLHGWVPREMIVADAVALHVNMPLQVARGPEVLRLRPSEENEAKQKRKERIEAIKEEFRRALAYDKVVSEAKAHQAALPLPDPRLAALVPYAKGQKPVIFHAEHRNEILDGLKLAEELKLKAVISGGSDAWKVAAALKAAKVPVLVAGTLRKPNEPTDPYDAPYANPARLFEAGVTVAIRSKESLPEQATASRNLPYEAAMAVAYGLPEAEALKAVTIVPAQILGLDAQVGSLDLGKRANLVITAGHILQPTTKVKALFLDGKPLTPESRHTRLYDRYLQRLAEVESGASPLGLDSGPDHLAAPAAQPTTPAPTPSGGR